MVLSAGIASLALGVLAFFISEWLSSLSNRLGRMDYLVWSRYLDWSDRTRNASVVLTVAALILIVASGRIG